MDRNGHVTPEQLRCFRKRWHISQANLARLLDIHKYTLSRWERGAQSISQTRLVFYALRYLEVRFVQRERRRRARTSV